ncbi:hypothetical protein Acsp02_09340 [Actinoplanes sp. NBRC 103695]|nr:hypothetical protein Acsp02_09340 [Actinoplanes sp. NBRC 103695]
MASGAAASTPDTATLPPTKTMPVAPERMLPEKLALGFTWFMLVGRMVRVKDQ